MKDALSTVAGSGSVEAEDVIEDVLTTVGNLDAAAKGLNWKSDAKTLNGVSICIQMKYLSGEGEAELWAVAVDTMVKTKDGKLMLPDEVQQKEGRRGEFLPYRLISRPLCCFGLTEEQEKERLYDEATKDLSDINDADMWHGFMALCCCGCNLIQMCCGQVMRTELLDVFSPSLTKSQAFSQIRTKASMMKWGCRLVGWLLMFFGLYATFSPFTTLLEVIPLGIGQFLSTLGSAIAWVFSFMVTLIISSVIIACAYTMYHPVWGLMWFAFIGVIVAGILVICNYA
jgi:hypothetical protein